MNLLLFNPLMYTYYSSYGMSTNTAGPTTNPTLIPIYVLFPLSYICLTFDRISLLIVHRWDLKIDQTTDI